MIKASLMGASNLKKYYPPFLYSKLFLLIFLYVFNFWLCWVFIAARWLSLVAARGGYSLVASSFSLQWLLLYRLGSREQAQ